MIARITLGAVLVAASFSFAQTVPPPQPLKVEADSNVIAGGELVLTGNLRLSDGTFLLLADQGKVREVGNTRIATATGHIQFTRGGIRLLADKLVYNTGDGSFSAEGVRLGSYPYFVEGFSAEGTRNEITITRAKLSYGEPGPWQPTVIADKVVIAPGQRVRTEKAAGGIGHMQPLPFPKFEHNIAQPFPLTAQITGGFRRSLGVFADATLHVPVSPSVRLGADVGIFTSRGLMLGPSGRYAKIDDPDALHGYFRTGYINDHGDKGFDLLNRPVPENRGFVEWQHQQTLAENLTLNAQLNWWRDSEVLRDFRPRAFFPVQQPDTFIESVYTGPNYFVSAFTRFQPNTFHRVQERLPEVRFDLLPVALGNGFYHRLEASAAVLREDPLPLPPGSLALSAPMLRSDRLDAYYALERPFAPTDWFAFTPVAGGRITHYANTRGVTRSGNYTRVLGEFGADAALRGSGTFDYQNPQWKIDGLRHLVTPRLSYRYVPNWDRGRRTAIPQIDRRTRIAGTDYLPYLQPLGLGDARNIDDLDATNTLRFGIDNVLQTRDATLGTRDLLVLNVANDFRFRRRPGEHDVSEIHTEMAVMPAPWLQFDLYGSAAPQNLSVRELNTGITIHDGNAWAVRFGNNYLRQDIQDLSLDGRFRINEKYEAQTKLHYDVRKQRFNEQSYGIVQNLGNTWLISYAVNLYSGRRRESSFGFRIEIDTVRF